MTEIKGKLVTLKELNVDFFGDIHAKLSSIVRAALHLPPATYEQTAAFLHEQLILHNQNKTLYYCIFDNKDKKLIGAVEIREKEINPGQLGIWINEAYWGGGRTQEAIQLIAREYFKRRGAPSFTARVRLENQRSYRALLKAGFVDAGFAPCCGEKAHNLVFEMKSKL